MKGSYHSLIYGSQITEQIEETELFKKYSLSDDHYIGFEYGRVYGIYDNLHYTYQGVLQLTQCEVPEKIKILFKETYPNLEGSSYALIQNLWDTSYHYVIGGEETKYVDPCYYRPGVIVHGYWIKDYKSDEWDQNIFEASFFPLSHNLEIIGIGDNMENRPSDYMIGMRIDEIDGDPKKAFEQLSTPYCHIDSNIPSRDKVLNVLHEIHSDIQITAIPMLCFVELSLRLK